MSTRTKIGLIECAAFRESQPLFVETLKEYQVKKVFIAGDFSADMLIKNYPGAEIVSDSQSIFQDGEIDLVIVSSPCMDQLDVAGEALQAGKHVRII